MPVNFHRFGFRLWVSLLLGSLGFAFAFLPAGKAATVQHKQQIASPGKPPVAPVKPVITDYYGTKVVDPYRYMENLKDPQVQAWMKAQNDYTRAVLARIPGREKLLARIRRLDQTVPQVQATQLPEDRYLILEALPGESTAKLYLRQGLGGENKLLVDPGKIKLAPADQAKGRNVITSFALSPNGKFLAVGITPGGSWPDTEIRLIETASGRETGDVLLHTFGSSPNWLPDNHSLVYGRLQKLPPGAPVTETEQKFRAYLHVLGTDPGKDPAIFGYGVAPLIHVDPRYLTAVGIQPGSRYALGEITTGVSPNSAFYIEPIAALGKTNAAWRKVAGLSDDIGGALSVTSDNLTTAVAVHADDLYLLTYKNAPRNKVIRTSARNPDLTAPETVVPPGQAVITGIHAAQDALYVELLDGGINHLLRVPYGPKPKVQDVGLPFKGALEVETDPCLPGALLGMNSYAKTYRIYAYNPKTKRVADTK